MPDNVPVWWVHEDWFEKEEFAEFRQATLAWITSLGLDPDRLAPRAAVVPYNGAYELHVDEIATALRDGQVTGDRGDPLAWNRLLTFRRIIPVELGSWPPKPETPAERI